jgi:hypothetical protein
MSDSASTISVEARPDWVGARPARYVIPGYQELEPPRPGSHGESGWRLRLGLSISGSGDTLAVYTPFGRLSETTGHAISPRFCLLDSRGEPTASVNLEFGILDLCSFLSTGAPLVVQEGKPRRALRVAIRSRHPGFLRTPNILQLGPRPIELRVVNRLHPRRAVELSIQGSGADAVDSVRIGPNAWKIAMPMEQPLDTIAALLIDDEANYVERIPLAPQD